MTGIILFISVMMANLAPVLILPLFHKYSPLPDGELRDSRGLKYPTGKVVCRYQIFHTCPLGHLIFLESLKDRLLALAQKASTRVRGVFRLAYADNFASRNKRPVVEATITSTINFNP